MEPLSVAVMAINKIGQMPLGANVVGTSRRCSSDQRAADIPPPTTVFGAGPVGLLTMAVARALGARNVLAVDIQVPRLEFAKSYAADDYHVPSKPAEGESRLAYSRRNVCCAPAEISRDKS